MSLKNLYRFRYLYKEGLWVIVGQTMGLLGSLAGVRLLTELLSPKDYGELALGITIATLVNQTVIGPLGNGITRFYAPASEKNDFKGYWDAVFRLVALATGSIIIIISITFTGFLIFGLSQWIPLAVTALIFAIFSGYNSILNGIQNAARNRPIVSFHQGIETWLRFLVVIVMVLLLGSNSNTAMAGYALSAVIMLGSQTLFIRKSIPYNGQEIGKTQNWQKSIWNYSWPFSMWGIFTWAQLVSDRWALELFRSTEIVGMYAVIFQLGYYPMAMMTGMTVQFVAPLLYQRAGDARDIKRVASVNKLSWRITVFALGIAFSAFVITQMCHSQIFRILVATEYAPVSYLLPWVVLSGGMFAAGQVLTLYFDSQMKTRQMVLPKIATALFGVTLNIAGAYLFGISGIVGAGVLYSMVYFFWVALLSKHQQLKVERYVFSENLKQQFDRS